MRARVLGACLALLCWLSAASAVGAHVELLGADPPDGASLPNAPPEIRLWFTEAVAPGFTDLTLLDSRGRRVEIERARISSDDARVLIANPGELGPGVYTLAYRALSAIDGHIDRGVLTFAVGTSEQIPSAIVTEMLGQPELWAASAVRGLGTLSALLMLGLLLFRSLVLDPTRAAVPAMVPKQGEQRLSWAVRVAAVVLILASAVQLVLQAAELSDGTVGGTLAAMETLTVRSRYGSIWLGRVAVGFLVLGLVRGAAELDAREQRHRWLGAAMLGLLGLYLAASSSHAASAFDGGWVGVALSWLHLACLAVWLGGLLGVLLLGIQEHDGRLKRLSAVGTCSFTGVLVSGVGQALVLVGERQALFSTVPGQILTGKLIAVMVIAGLAWINRRAVGRTGWVAGDSLSVVRRIRAEVGIAFGVVLLTSVLVLLPPAWQTYQQQLRGQPIELRRQADGVEWLLRVEPGRPGVNAITLRPSSATTLVSDGRFLLTYQQEDVPSRSLVAEPVSGVLAVTTDGLSLAGTWSVEAIVRSADQPDRLFQFGLELAGPGTPVPPPPLLRGELFSAGRLVAAGLIVLGVGLFSFVYQALGLRNAEGRGLAGATLIIALLGVYVAARPDSGGASASAWRRATNPIPATEASVTRGRELFAAECALCHGPTGAGDGDQMATNGRVLTDLRLHLSTGHTDGDLYHWISAGVAGTEMRGFAEALPEDDRWHLVNALRALGDR